MKIEIVDCYPIKQKKETKNGKNFKASFHIYLCDYSMDIRGISLYKSKDKYKFILPWLTNYDFETKKWVRFPTISFTDKEQQDKIMDFLNDEGIKYYKSVKSSWFKKYKSESSKESA